MRSILFIDSTKVVSLLNRERSDMCCMSSDRMLMNSASSLCMNTRSSSPFSDGVGVGMYVALVF